MRDGPAPRPNVTPLVDRVVSFPEEEAISDGQVVAAVLAGDTEAFRILIHRYQDRYTRFAVRMLGDRDDADDALQTAFVRAYRKLEQCQDPERFGSWLYQILVNECRTLGARRGQRERRMVHDSDALNATRVEPMTSFEHEQLDLPVQEALNQLEPAQREVFVLKYVEELNYEEIAELTGVGVSALKMRVKRASDRLRVLLTSYKETSPNG